MDDKERRRAGRRVVAIACIACCRGTQTATATLPCSSYQHLALLTSIMCASQFGILKATRIIPLTLFFRHKLLWKNASMRCRKFERTAGGLQQAKSYFCGKCRIALQATFLEIVCHAFRKVSCCASQGTAAVGPASEMCVQWQSIRAQRLYGEECYHNQNIVRGPFCRGSSVESDSVEKRVRDSSNRRKVGGRGSQCDNSKGNENSGPSP